MAAVETALGDDFVDKRRRNRRGRDGHDGMLPRLAPTPAALEEISRSEISLRGSRHARRGSPQVRRSHR